MIAPRLRLGDAHPVPGRPATIFPLLLQETRVVQPEHGLVMFPSAPESILARDTGAIDAVTLTNTGRRPIYVRAGTLFEGLGTQSRTNVADVVVPPGVSVDVQARCVHMSHGIAAGASFRSRGETAPVQVERSLRAGQGETWRGVGEYVEKTSAQRKRVVSAAHDQLISAKAGAWGADDEVAAIFENVPRLRGQVGLLTVCRGRVLAFEAFADERSWSAYADDVLRKHIDALLLDGPAVEPDRVEAEAALRRANGIMEEHGDGAFAEGITIATHEGEVVRIARYE